MEIIQWINVSVSCNGYDSWAVASLYFIFHLDLGGGDGKDIEDITWPRGYTKFIFEWRSVEKYFTSERSERVKYFSTRDFNSRDKLRHPPPPPPLCRRGKRRWKRPLWDGKRRTTRKKIKLNQKISPDTKQYSGNLQLTLRLHSPLDSFCSVYSPNPGVTTRKSSSLSSTWNNKNTCHWKPHNTRLHVVEAFTK